MADNSRGGDGRGVVDATPSAITPRIIDFGNRTGGYGTRGSGVTVSPSVTDRASSWVGGSSLTGRSAGRTVAQTPTASMPNDEETDGNGWPLYFADILGGAMGERSRDVPIAVIEGSGASSISPTLIILGLVGVGVAIYYFNRKGA